MGIGEDEARGHGGTYQLAGLLGLGHLGVELGLGVARDHDSLLGRHFSLLPLRWDRTLLWIKVSFEGWIARLRWWPHPERVHAVFIGAATGTGNDQKAPGGSTSRGEDAGFRRSDVTALVGRLPCFFSKFQESVRRRGSNWRKKSSYSYLPQKA